MTWGTSDILALMENHQYYWGTDRLDYIEGYVNLQSFCERRVYYERGKQMGLSTAAQLLGIDVQEWSIIGRWMTAFGLGLFSKAL